MRKFGNIFLIILSYLLAFIISLTVSGIVINQGKGSNMLQTANSSLPVMYVRTAGRLLNEMHGYTEPIDAGYYRDTLTPVGDSKTINLSFLEYAHHIESADYELYDDQYKTLIEEGACSTPEDANGMFQTEINLKNVLLSNREYCLRIMLTDSDGQVINYYTRVRYGSDLKIAEKMKFVLDFNEATFDKGNVSKVASYLEGSTSTSSNFSLVTLYSSSDAVTWGQMAPYRTSEMSIRLKEINTETATFTLSYTIETSAGDMTTFYNVDEYYRIRWTSYKVYLLDFERKMTEDIRLSDIRVESGAFRLGVGESEDIELQSYGDENGEYSYFIVDDQLWIFDTTNRILTKVYARSDENHHFGQEDELGIRVIHADKTNGDIYFIAYGYIDNGSYEGREGVMLYHFSHTDVMLEEVTFIPFEKGFTQLESGLKQLAYMNDQDEAYILLENTVYKINTENGEMIAVWTDLNSDNCVASEDGILVMGEGTSQKGSNLLRLINLNTGEEKVIERNGLLITPIGFTDKDFIYGLINPQRAVADSTGMIQYPITELHIVDENLDEVRSYKKDGAYIKKVTISDGSIIIKLVTAVNNGAYTDYQDAGEDYIIKNDEENHGSVYLDSKRDTIRGWQNWLRLSTTDSFVPIHQSARNIAPNYDIIRHYEANDSEDMRYYVYTKGRLDAIFDTVQEAIDYGNTYAGTVMTSHKQVIWQRAGRAYVWDFDIDAIESMTDGLSMNQVILDTIADYEGWDKPTQVNPSEPIFSAMGDVFSVDMIDLTGVAMTDIFHFVYRDRIVVAKIAENTYGMIVAYDENNMRVHVADPRTGVVSSITWDEAEALFAQNGNVFYSYLD